MDLIYKKQIFENYKKYSFEEIPTFGEMLDELEYPKEIHKYVEIRVNGQKVNQKYWYYAKPNENVNVSIALVPAGGDNDSLLATVGLLAVVATGAGAGNFAAQAVSGVFAKAFVSTAVAASFTALGYLAVKELFKPAEPTSTGLLSLRRKKLNAITGQSNQIDPYGVVIKNFGSNQIFPRLVTQPAILQVGNDQYLIAVYDFGSGRNHINTETIQIGKSNANFFEGVDYNVVNNPDDFELYTTNTTTSFPNALYENVGDSTIRSSSENAKSILLTFSWPQGLAGIFGSSGIRKPLIQRIGIELKEEGSTTWRRFNEQQWTIDTDRSVVTKTTSRNQVIIAPTIGNSPSVSYSAPVRKSFYILESYVFDPFEGTTAFPTYTVTFDSNEIWHKPVTAGDIGARSGPIELYDGFTSTFLGVGDSIILGGQRYRVINENIGEVIIGGRTFRKVKVDRKITFSSEVRAYPGWYMYDFANLSNVVNDGSALMVRTVGSLESFIQITKDTLEPFSTQVRLTPRGDIDKKWDVRVTYNNLDVTDGTIGKFDVSSSFGIGDARDLIHNFFWERFETDVKTTAVITSKEHTYLELKVKATDDINGVVDTLSAVAESYLPVYDSVNGIWNYEISNNPAWVFAEILTGSFNQRAVSFDKLDTTSLVAWANYCDTNKITYQENEIGFECNFVLDYETTVKQLLDQVCSCGRATFNIINGKYGVVIDEIKTTPVQIFNQRNIISMNVSRNFSKTPDAIRVSFIDPNSGWQQNSVIAYDDGKDSSNSTLIEDLESFAVTNLAQAWRLGRYFLAQHKLRKDIVTIETDFEGLACNRGDLVFFSHDVIKEGGIPARITAIDGNIITIDEIAVDNGGTQVLTCRNRLTNTVENYSIISFPGTNQIELDSVENMQINDLCVYGTQDEVVKEYLVKGIKYSQDLRVTIELTEYNTAIFNADVGDIPDYFVKLVSEPLTGGALPSAVNDLTFDYTITANQNEKKYLYNAKLSWNKPDFGIVKNYEIYVTTNGETNLVGYSESLIFNYAVKVQNLNTEHTIRVIAVNNEGGKISYFEGSSITFTPENDTTAPGEVLNFNANILTDTIELDWQLVSDNDIDKYLIRFSPNTETAQWAQSTSIASAGPTQTSKTVPLRTGTYLIKAIDYAGNSSLVASRIVTNVPELSKIEFITNISAPAWNGTNDQTQLLGDSLIIKSINNLASFVDDFGEFFFEDIFDLGDVFTARFVADISASGFSQTGLMSNWTTLASIDPIAGTFTEDDFDVGAYIRTRNEPDVMANWNPLSSVDYLSFGSELTASPWVKFKSTDFTGRIFQLKIRLEAKDLTITPIVYSVSIDAHWNERIINGLDQLSGDPVVFDGAFVEKPSITITSIENISLGDEYLFTSSDETGFEVQFYDNTGTPVNDRKYDWIAKGIGKKYTLDDVNF